MHQGPIRSAITRVRVDVGARGFSVLAGFTLAALASDAAASAGVALLLIAIASVMCWWAIVDGPMDTTYLYALVAEGAFAMTLIALSPSATDTYIVYVAAPPLLAGLRGGLFPAFATVVAESLSLLAIHAQGSNIRTDLLDVASPWILTGFAVGLLGAWIRQLRLAQRETRTSPYASAHRLLGQLRTITRGLPGGLDIEAVSEDVLLTSMNLGGGARAALLLRNEAGDFVVVATRGEESQAHKLEGDELVTHAIEFQHPVQDARDAGSTQSFRVALPLVIGGRAIGAVVVEGPGPFAPEDLDQLQETLDDAALRLESAVLFGDVRANATVEERHRLAREIHDGIAQEIASLGYIVDDLARDNCSHDHQPGLSDLREELTRVVTELRLSIFDLRSGVSTNAGLGSVLGDYVREIGKGSGMAVHLSLEESPRRLRLDVETELLRIAQEAITNARKHSRGGNLWVTCRVEPPFAELRIEDDGVGSPVARDGHYGLHSMKERATRINAVLTIGQRPGGGTAVSAVLLPNEAIVPIPHNGEHHVLQRAAGR